MIKNQILIFLLRWAASAAGMWIIINLFSEVSRTISGDFWLYIVAGLVFSLVNSIIRPLTTLLSLPLIILSMGIFMVIINIAMVALTIWILPGVSISFWGAFAGMLTMSIINGLVNLLVPSRQRQ